MEQYIKDETIYYLGKDIDGIKHTTKELQVVLLDIAIEFDRVCRKNNIPYALAFGSTIGAINYSGFVPWDDDMDIAISYEDVPNLIDALKKDLKSEYSFECYETDPKYMVIKPTLKIRKKNTYIKESNSLHLPNRCEYDGIFVDVVAFMGVPEDPKEHLKLIKKSKRQMPFYVFFESYFHINLIRMKNRLKLFEKKVAKKYENSNKVSQTVIIPFQNWTIAHPVNELSFPRDVIYPFKEIMFEGHSFYTFAKPEEFIKLYYGPKAIKHYDGEKFIDLYPEKKRKTTHIVKYSLSRSKK